MSYKGFADLRIPAELQPFSTREEITIPIELIATRDYTRAQINELQSKLGLAYVSESYLRPLRHLGCAGKQLACIGTKRGGVFLTAQALVQAINACQKIATSSDDKYDVSQRLKACRLAGYLYSKLIDAASAHEAWVVRNRT